MNVVSIIEVLGYENIHEPIEKGNVASHLDGQMEGRMPGKTRAPRINNVKLCAFPHRIFKKRSSNRVGFRHIRTYYKEHLGFGKVGEGVGHCPGAKMVASPATVGACQVRAQLSMLLVPITDRNSFCI